MSEVKEALPLVDNTVAVRRPEVVKIPGLTFGKEFSLAMLQVQKHIRAARKSGRNTFINYEYETLTDIMEVVRPALNAASMWVTQMTITVPGEDFTTYYVRTFVVHAETGQCIYSDTPMFPKFTDNPANVKGQINDSQEFGKAQTYARKSAIDMLFIPANSNDVDSDSTPEDNISGEVPKQTLPISGSVGNANRQQARPVATAPQQPARPTTQQIRRVPEPQPEPDVEDDAEWPPEDEEEQVPPPRQTPRPAPVPQRPTTPTGYRPATPQPTGRERTR